VVLQKEENNLYKLNKMKTKMQRGGLTATNRKTAMTALGIKPKSKEFDPSRFGDKASVGTTRKKYAEGGPTLGPVYSGPTGGRGGAGTYEPPVTKKTPTTGKQGKMQMGGAKKMKKAISKKPSGYMPAEGVTKGGMPTASKAYKTGGMVNSNAKVSALKVAGTKGTKSGVNSKVSASKVAKGRSGGVSKAPKKANP
jgi:hypothetical protein